MRRAMEKGTVLVVGLGASGVAAAELLLAKGHRVLAADAAPRERLRPEALALEARGVELHAGTYDPSFFERAERCVVSPGVPGFRELEDFERSGREVIGELELASRHVEAPIALV